MFISHLWKPRCDEHSPNGTVDLDDRSTESCCPILMEQASSTLPQSQILAFREIIRISTTRSKWDRDQLIALFDEETIRSWKRENETYSAEWLDEYEQMKFCLTRSTVIEAVDQIERYQKLSLRTKGTAAINALLDFCRDKSNELQQVVSIRFYVNAVWSSPLDTVEYFANFSNLSQFILSRIEMRAAHEGDSRNFVDEADALLFHQFLWVLWTSGLEHVGETAIWEVAFKLIEICRRDKARFAHAYFYAGKDWQRQLRLADSETALKSGPMLDILLESAPSKDDGYDVFVEKKFPFGPDSKVHRPLTQDG